MRNKIHFKLNWTTLFIALSLSIGLKAENQNPHTQGITRAARPIEPVLPEYPPLALALAIEGWVKVGFVISAEGDVTDAWVIENHPSDVFDEAALEAIRNTAFLPTIKYGKAIEQKATQTLEFTVKL